MKIEIYADGACRGNQVRVNIGAIGVVIIEDGKVVQEISKAYCNTTNNKMEILAIIKALEYCQEHYSQQPLTIYTDSQYVINIMNNHYKAKANLNYWQRVHILLTNFGEVTFVKVKGHDCNVGNLKADDLCNIAMDEEIAKGRWKC